MYNFRDKKTNVNNANNYVLAKTLSMFKWGGLPDTIPHRELERMLQTKGYAFITEVEGELYAFHGGLGGVPDAYNRPTEIVIANPALKFNKTLNIQEDGVLIHSDDMNMGIFPLVDKYNTLMVENDVTITIHGFNTRINTMISASDDRTKESADAFLKGIEDGNVASIGESAMFDGIKAHKGGDNQPVTSLIELQQYMKASLHNEIGLSANFNMKRERLNSDEVQQNEDSTYPFVDNMLECRLEAIAKINEKYGTEITVEYGSIWATRNQEREQSEPEQEPEAVEPEQEQEPAKVEEQEQEESNDEEGTDKRTGEVIHYDFVEVEPEQEPESETQMKKQG